MTITERLRRRRLPSPALAKAIREAAFVSQQDVADELSVHRTTVARWEAGVRRPRARAAEAYADLLSELRREAE